MSKKVMSLAVMEPFDGKESEFLACLHDLYSLLERKGYSRDELLRGHQDAPYYINVRYWTSAEARRDAQEDPEVHRFWAQLGHLCQMRRVHETLEVVDWKKAE